MELNELLTCSKDCGEAEGGDEGNQTENCHGEAGLSYDPWLDSFMQDTNDLSQPRKVGTYIMCQNHLSISDL